MPVPGVSPLALSDSICPNCSSVMAKKVISTANGKFSHIMYACEKCDYSFQHRPPHLNGDFQGYKVFTGEAVHTKPPGM